jgi:hypothetical protein
MPLTYRELFTRTHARSLIDGLAMLLAALVADHFANAYALIYSERPTTTFVGDLLLDNLPVINLNLLIVEGALLAILISIILVLLKPQYLPFTLKALSLFIITRAFFMSLTHIGIYPGQINPGVGPLDALYSWLNFETGFFFSGHTGMPFLMALIFWDVKRIRVAYIALSVTFGIAVLLAHVHYSIDVFAAPFITYGIFRISQRLFATEYRHTTVEQSA